MRFRVLSPVIALGLLSACDRPARVAAGRIRLPGGTPVVVPFDAPVRAVGPTRELCLVGSRGNVTELRPEGAVAVRAVLLTAAGGRDTMGAPNYDRRGDEMVCLQDHDLGRRPAAAATPVTYRGVELTASAFIRLRELRWWDGQHTVAF